MNIRRTVLGGLVCLAAAVPLHAQVSTRILAVRPAEVPAGVPVVVTADLQESATLTGLAFVYRPFGESQYRILEMDLTGNRASVTLPATVLVPPFLEYYIVLRDHSGALEVYPQSEGPDPFANPPGTTQRIRVVDAPSEETQVVFLSPDPGSALPLEEIVVSVSFLRVDSLVDRSATKLLVDGSDVTGDAVATGDILVYVPANAATPLPPGPHTVTVMLFNRQGLPYHTSSLPFIVAGEGFLAGPREAPASFAFNGGLQLESRRENVGEGITWYNRAGLQLLGSYGELRSHINLFLTSDEKKDRQPQNRYYASLEMPWFTLEAGDAYPLFPDLILSGKRVRGVTGEFRAGFFNLQATYGSVSRAIDGTLLEVFPLDSLSSRQAEDPTATYAPTTGTLWGKGEPGTYARSLFAIRPSFGSGETFQIGFTWLNSRDDYTSINFGVRPKENIVLGSDLTLRLDGRRIEAGFQAAFSAFNSDISSGSFTDAYVDTVYPDDAGQIKQLRDLLGNLITVNDYFRPLSLEYPATVAAEARLALDYFGNYLRAAYLFRGADYVTFGQTYLRTDIQGLNLSDRIRLIENTVYATIGYERLSDNTANTKPSTTVFSNLNFAVSYYPVTSLPSFTAGYTRYRNVNDVNPDSLLAINDVTNRLYLQSMYTFELGAQQTLLLNLSSSVRDDQARTDQDVNNFTALLGVTTRWAIPLQTDVAVAMNLNDLPGNAPGTSTELNYTTLTFAGRYALIPETLTLSGTLAPTLGDFVRTIFDLRLEWMIQPPMTLLFQFSYFRNDGIPNDSFFSLRYFYTF
jgi:hypothetical protein